VRYLAPDSRLHGLGWLNEIRESRWPNKKNLQPALLNASIDPGRKVTAPYMSGMVGLAYNRAATNRDITSVDDLWDTGFKGKVSMLSDTQEASVWSCCRREAHRRHHPPNPCRRPSI
jgi:spermidine/putrescine transport system substrate-binding protein